MDVNSLPKTVTRQRRSCDLNPGPSAPESSTLTTRLPSHPLYLLKSRLVLPFWHRLAQLVVEKRPLNGCVSSDSSYLLTYLLFRYARGVLFLILAARSIHYLIRDNRYSS